MRIEAIPAAATVEPSVARNLRNPVPPAAEVRTAEPSLTPRPPVLQPRERSVSVSFIENQVILYRFLDKETGDLLQQVPPEEMLQVMRNIDNLLNAENHSAQKLDLRW